MVSGIADKRDSGTASSSKRVSWAPLPMLGDEEEQQAKTEAEVCYCWCTNLPVSMYV